MPAPILCAPAQENNIPMPVLKKVNGRFIMTFPKVMPVRPVKPPNAGPCYWSAMPTDVVIEIICRVPYSTKNFANLVQVDIHVAKLLKLYEASISLNIAKLQFPLVCATFPPRALNFNGPCYAWLRIIHRRARVIHSLSHRIRSFRQNGYYPLRNQPDRWRRVTVAGLLLIYRLQDTPTHASKVGLINSLPLISIVAIKFALMFISMVAQDQGRGLIYRGWANGDMNMEADVCLIFNELHLVKGPEFAARILNNERSMKIIGQDEATVPILRLPARKCPICGTAVSPLVSEETYVCNSPSNSETGLELRGSDIARACHRCIINTHMNGVDDDEETQSRNTFAVEEEIESLAEHLEDNSYVRDPDQHDRPSADIWNSEVQDEDYYQDWIRVDDDEEEEDDSDEDMEEFDNRHRTQIMYEHLFDPEHPASGNDIAATELLYRHWAALEEYQLHGPDANRLRTLTSHLTAMFCNRDGCSQRHITFRMWQLLQHSKMNDMQEHEIQDVMDGTMEDVKGGIGSLDLE